MADLSGMFGTIDAALAQGAPPPDGPPPTASGASAAPTPAGSSAYQRTMDALNAALAQGDGPAASGDTPSTLTIQHGPSYAHTTAAIDAILNAPPGSRIIAGSAPVVPAGLTPPSRGGRSSDVDPSPPSRQAAPTPAATRNECLYGDDALGLTPAASPAASPPTPGPLSNSADDGWVSGAAKGAATAAIKGVGDAVGFVGGLGGLADYLMARGESAVTGQPVDEVLADLVRKKAAQQAGSIVQGSELGLTVVYVCAESGIDGWADSEPLPWIFAYLSLEGRRGCALFSTISR